MKLYMHPASTTCRPIMMFIVDHEMKVDTQVVDIMTGEQYQPAFAAINPNNAVPVLEDGPLRMTESSAILKYLADKIDSPTYPKDLQERARVNEIMDWFNTGFYRTFGYGLCYSQLLDSYKLKSEQGQKEAVAVAKTNAERYLGILDKHILAPSRSYICRDRLTIADYFGVGILSVGEVIGCRFEAYTNITRWYERMKRQPSWKEASAGLFHWADAARGPAYTTV